MRDIPLNTETPLNTKKPLNKVAYQFIEILNTMSINSFVAYIIGFPNVKSHMHQMLSLNLIAMGSLYVIDKLGIGDYSISSHPLDITCIYISLIAYEKYVYSNLYSEAMHSDSLLSLYQLLEVSSQYEYLQNFQFLQYVLFPTLSTSLLKELTYKALDTLSDGIANAYDKIVEITSDLDNLIVPYHYKFC